jgi:hypothetical protein
MHRLIAAAELVARTAAATFLSTWLISQKFDLRNLEYAGGAAGVSAAVCALAYLQGDKQTPTLTPSAQPSAP